MVRLNRTVLGVSIMCMTTVVVSQPLQYPNEEKAKNIGGDPCLQRSEVH